MDFLHFKRNEEDFVPLSQDFFFWYCYIIFIDLGNKNGESWREERREKGE